MGFDLVRMEKPSDDSAKFIDVRKGAQNFFLIRRDLASARAACKRAKFLFFESYDSDAGLMKSCAEKNCTLVISMSDLLHLPPAEKAKKIARIRQFVFFANHFCAKTKVVTLARNEFELRNGYEIASVGELLGFTQAQMEKMEDEEIRII